MEFSLPGHHSQTQSFRADMETTQAAVLEPLAPPRLSQERARRRAARRMTPTNAPLDRDLDSRARTINPFAR